MASADRRPATPVTPARAVPPSPPAKPAGVPKPTAAGEPVTPSVEQLLFDEPYLFNFLQAVRILTFVERKRGSTVRRLEPIRFRANPTLTFPPSQINSIERPTEAGRPVNVTINFLGLTGPGGVLPLHYTEMLIQIRRQRRTPERDALRDWFDLFNHRFIHLFFKSWEKYRFYIPFERAEYDQQELDPFTKAIFSFVGMGTPTLRNRLRVAQWFPYEAAVDEFEAIEYGKEEVLAKVDDFSLAHYSGLLAQRNRPAIGLQRILSDFYSLPVQLKQFQGQWIKFETADRSQLGVEGTCGTLGLDVVLGERMWDVQSKVRIRLGPLNYEQFVEFLPDRTPIPQRKAFFLLVHLLRLYIGPALDFDVQLILQAKSVPVCQISSQASLGARLGWNTWLVSRPVPKNAEDVVLQGEEVVWVNREVKNEARRS